MVPKQLIWSDFPFLVECDSSAESGLSGAGCREQRKGQKGPLSIGRSRNRGDLSRERNTYLSRKFSIALFCFFSLWFSLLEQRAGIGALHHPGCKIRGCLVLKKLSAENNSIEITN